MLPRSTLRLQRKPSSAPPAPPCPGDGGNRRNRRLQPCRGGHGAGHGAGRGQGEVPHMWQGGPWGGSLLHHRHPALLSPPPAHREPGPTQSALQGQGTEPGELLAQQRTAGSWHRRDRDRDTAGAVPAAQGGPAGRWQPRGQQQDINQPRGLRAEHKVQLQPSPWQHAPGGSTGPEAFHTLTNELNDAERPNEAAGGRATAGTGPQVPALPLGRAPGPGPAARTAPGTGTGSGWGRTGGTAPTGTPEEVLRTEPDPKWCQGRDRGNGHT